MTTPPAPPEPLDPWPARARALFPAGSNGEFGLPPNLVTVLDRGQGCRVWDTAGQPYLDMSMAWGSALVGHAHPKVLEAAAVAARDGANFAAVNRRSVQLAERLSAICPCAARVRFVASGTEATLLCLRIAHVATGRSKVLRFAGAYLSLAHDDEAINEFAGRLAEALGSLPPSYRSADHRGDDHHARHQSPTSCI
ncbi:MAG: aminotransferase class III-fold pyridoxal phosphate-dependent enzyme [Verrucomicrobiales bacterium]|nr:aminotransferase class III-fold pyridoxal phosphate-dependent enzyme [Verrucomicrobiales bacterium]